MSYSKEMNKKYKQACLVELAPAATWRRLCDAVLPSKTKELTFSASGVIFFLNCGYVISHGSLLLSHFSKNKKSLKLLKNDFIDHETFAYMKTLVTVDPLEEQNLSILKQDFITSDKTLFNQTSSRNTTKPEQYLGNIKCLWKAKGFADAVESFLPTSEGWSFFEEPDKDLRNSDDIDPKLVAKLLPYFVLIELEGCPHHNYDEKLYKDALTIGDPVHMVGTPFAAMSPAVFLNSVSQGVVCNVAGKNQDLIITDARCIPGTEGGPLYSGHAKRSEGLVGVVASALCWKANEWIGLSLACHIGEVMNSLLDHMQHPELLSALQHRKPIDASAHNMNHQRISVHPDNIPVTLVRAPGSWGSGLLVHQDSGLVLTCGHVVNGQKNVRVRMASSDPEWFDADVLHATSVNNAFDIGVLQLRDYIPRKQWPSRVRIAETIEEGSASSVFGHAVFGQQHNLPASMTSGVISKVIRSHGAPVLIQSTCTVNAGASGGPLVNDDGSICGIVACNAKDTVTGASYPNINLSVPLVTIWPVIQEYIDSQDSSVLKSLHIKDEEITALWTMHGSERDFDVIKSKL